MLEEDGPKRLGRYLKKDSLVYQVVKIQPFRFENIGSAPSVFPDNDGNNVFHKRLHTSKEFSNVTRDHESVRDNLLDPSLRVPIIQPRDFTQDWIEEKRKMKKRAKNVDEDEDDDSFLGLDDEVSSSPAASSPEETQPAREDSAVANPAPAAEGETPSHPLEDLASTQLRIRTEGDEAPPDIDAASSTPAAEASSAPPPAHETEIAAPSPGAEAPPDVVAAPAEEPEVSPASAEETDSAYQRGLAEGRQQAEALRQELAPLVQELAELKEKVVARSRDNFVEVAHAVGQALLGKEIDESPGSLIDLIKRAKGGDGEGPLEISISPDLHGRLPDQDWGATVKADPELAPGEFRVVQNDEVLSSSVREVLSQFLEQAQVQLFSDDEDDS